MNSNKYILDRFENEIAVFLKVTDETEQLLIEKNKINISVHEGDIVKIQGGSDLYTFVVLEKETRKQKEKIQQMLKQLKTDNR